MKLHWPMWHIVLSRHFMDDFEGHWESLIPYYMRYTHHEWDRNVHHWHHKWIAPYARLWYWWASHRWMIERELRRIGVLIVREGEHCKYWKFNWDWRWYNSHLGTKHD